MEGQERAASARRPPKFTASFSKADPASVLLLKGGVPVTHPAPASRICDMSCVYRGVVSAPYTPLKPETVSSGVMTVKPKELSGRVRAASVDSSP